MSHSTNLLGRTVVTDPEHAKLLGIQDHLEQTGEIVLIQVSEGMDGCKFGVLWPDGKMTVHASDCFIIETEEMKARSRLHLLSGKFHHQLKKDAKKILESGQLSKKDLLYLERVVKDQPQLWPDAGKEYDENGAANKLHSLGLIYADASSRDHVTASNLGLFVLGLSKNEEV